MPTKKKTSTHQRRVDRLQKWFEYVAYVSLAADIAIAIVTLAYVRTHSSSLLGLQMLLNYALTAIVLVSIAIVAVMTSILVYMKLLEKREGRR